MAIRIHTRRLVLSQIEARDWPFFLLLQTDPEVMRYVSDQRSGPEIRARFESRLPDWRPASLHWLCLVVSERDTRQPVGLTGFCRCPEAASSAEVGYLFAPAFGGRGYATESLLALIEYAREQGFDSLVAVVSSGNAASERVLARCGFVPDGVTPAAIELGGRWHDDLHYRLGIRQDEGRAEAWAMPAAGEAGGRGIS